MEKYLLLDRRILSPQGMENVQIKTTQAKKDCMQECLFTEQEPWEVRIDNGYPNVIYDPQEKIYRCYYTLFTHDPESEGVSREERARKDYIPRPEREPGLAYAESRDGISWTKPSLGMVEWRGSNENNLLFRYAHGTGVMLDEREENPQRRYKMVTKVDQPEAEAFMAVNFSPDGIHWEAFTPWPLYNPPADSHNLPFWNEKEQAYNLISRVWKDGIRIATISKSEDFIHWSEPKETLRGSGFERQIYAMPVFSWGNLYLGFASVIHEGDRSADNFDCVDCELAWAASPDKFDWAAPGESLIPRGAGRYPAGAPDCGCIYASPPVKDEHGDLWLYYMGGSGQHTNYRETSLMRASLKKDRFAAYETKHKGTEGILATSKVRLTGEALEILAEPECPDKPCTLQAMLCTSWNQPALDGASYEECMITDEKSGWKKITFPKQQKALEGTEVCIKLRFENLKLWAIQGDIRLESHRLWEGAGEKAEL